MIFIRFFPDSYFDIYFRPKSWILNIDTDENFTFISILSGWDIKNYSIKIK
jgi:hypothetical protein